MSIKDPVGKILIGSEKKPSNVDIHWVVIAIDRQNVICKQTNTKMTINFSYFEIDGIKDFLNSQPDAELAINLASIISRNAIKCDSLSGNFSTKCVCNIQVFWGHRVTGVYCYSKWSNLLWTRYPNVTKIVSKQRSVMRNYELLDQYCHKWEKYNEFDATNFYDRDLEKFFFKSLACLCTRWCLYVCFNLHLKRFRQNNTYNKKCESSNCRNTSGSLNSNMFPLNMKNLSEKAFLLNHSYGILLFIKKKIATPLTSSKFRRNMFRFI